jgi:hypothetical protein
MTNTNAEMQIQRLCKDGYCLDPDTFTRSSGEAVLSPSFYCAQVTFDHATSGTQGAHASTLTIPDNAIIFGGFIDVIEGLTSAANTATVAIHVLGANDIVTATIVSNAQWTSIGIKAVVPVFSAATAIKLTAAKHITSTVATQDLTAGNFVVNLFYVVTA